MFVGVGFGASASPRSLLTLLLVGYLCLSLRWTASILCFFREAKSIRATRVRWSAGRRKVQRAMGAGSHNGIPMNEPQTEYLIIDSNFGICMSITTTDGICFAYYNYVFFTLGTRYATRYYVFWGGGLHCSPRGHLYFSIRKTRG